MYLRRAGGCVRLLRPAMKNKMKKNLGLIGAFLLVFLAGSVTMRVWDSYQGSLQQNRPSVTSEAENTDSLLIVNMDEATTPEGVTEAEETPLVDDSTIPSQLSKIKLEGISQIVSKTGTSVNGKSDDSSPVQLAGDGRAVIPTGTAQQAPETDSKISMIEAPVQVKVIKTLADYKAFKRVARGSYPVANFAEDYVVVLESTSNLPDKVFEIQDIVSQDGKMVVLYRVNIFGLDGKINTHSAARIAKTDLPIELQQVL